MNIQKSLGRVFYFAEGNVTHSSAFANDQVKVQFFFAIKRHPLNLMPYRLI